MCEGIFTPIAVSKVLGTRTEAAESAKQLSLFDKTGDDNC